MAVRRRLPSSWGCGAEHAAGDHAHQSRPITCMVTSRTITALRRSPTPPSRPLDRAALAAAIDALPAGVVRAKGIFYLADDPGEQVILQVAGRRREWQIGEPWGDARPYSRLVLIGPRALVDEESLRAGLSVLLTPTPQ